MAKKHCPHCGASMVEYPFRMSAALAKMLTRVYRAGGPVNIDGFFERYSQGSNFPKLLYWGLIESVGGLRRGVWAITEKGRKFVRGTITVPRTVWTYRGVVVRTDGPEVAITDPLPSPEWRVEDYAAHAVAH